jgi:hypothetical protein
VIVQLTESSERRSLTNAAVDKHFFGCGFAAMVVVCLQLN